MPPRIRPRKGEVFHSSTLPGGRPLQLKFTGTEAGEHSVELHVGHEGSQRVHRVNVKILGDGRMLTLNVKPSDPKGTLPEGFGDMAPGVLHLLEGSYKPVAGGIVVGQTGKDAHIMGQL